tara:strand:- start:459 stop:743 length:285 start_codon:yes stop_codon:yes gene_type:complete
MRRNGGSIPFKLKKEIQKSSSRCSSRALARLLGCQNKNICSGANLGQNEVLIKKLPPGAVLTTDLLVGHRKTTKEGSNARVKKLPIFKTLEQVS